MLGLLNFGHSPKLLAIAVADTARCSIVQSGAVAGKEDGVKDRGGATHAEQEAERKADRDRDGEVAEHCMPEYRCRCTPERTSLPVH